MLNDTGRDASRMATVDLYDSFPVIKTAGQETINEVKKDFEQDPEKSNSNN
jgi:hypothetical protein